MTVRAIKVYQGYARDNIRSCREGPPLSSRAVAHTNDAAIDTIPNPACPVCGGAGTVLHDGVVDRLFSAPGTWRLRICMQAECLTVWPDPAPSESGLVTAYARYYTHEQQPLERGDGGALVLRWLWQMTGLSGERLALRRMLLDGVAPGRVLDVGCGDGRRFEALEALGWRVEGQEVDGDAAAAARRAGRTVHLGAISILPLVAGAFDAVTMNHVIEHVREPLAMLRDCRRLLRSGGRLVAITPNAASLGHRTFAEHWRGLEPPRHLQVFTPESLAAIANQAGFAHVDVRTSAANAYTFAVASLGTAARSAGASPAFIAGRLAALRFQWQASRTHRANALSGEECLLMAVA